MSDRLANKEKKKIGAVICWCIAGFLLLLAYVIMLATRIYNQEFGVPFTSLLYTIVSSTEGANVDFIWTRVLEILPRILIFLAIYIICAFFILRKEYKLHIPYRKDKKFTVSVRVLSACFLLIVSIAAMVYSVVKMNRIVGISEYFIYQRSKTTVYEDYYTEPSSVKITAPEQKQNLIFIYLESMETTYASKDAGGNQTENYISGLTALAKDNISFSNNDGLGGFATLPGTDTTVNSIFSTQLAIPFALPINDNRMTAKTSFAPNVVGLGDVLEQYGYNQEFLCGSDASFAGRDALFKEHGNFEIFDYYEAIRKGYIPDDYYEWWGFEDSYLYQIAKDELLRLSNEEAPFNLTMLTVDTHFPNGYKCDLCDDKYDELAANVISCADRQLSEFINWVTQQDFYKNTSIVIIGDHPRMDSVLVEGINYNDRKMYNCFINAQADVLTDTQNRSFSAMDIMPTVLEALGFKIDGGRYGMGTSLFSGEATLLEQKSIDFWASEFQKKSDYYAEKIF